MLNRDVIIGPGGEAVIAPDGQATPAGGLRGLAAELDFAKIKVALRRNRLILIGIIAGFLLIGLVATLLATPIYRAVASVQLEEQSSRVLGTEDVEPATNGLDAERFLQTQVDILNSRSLAIRVAERLNLFRDDSFLIAMGEEGVSDVSDPAQLRTLRREKVVAKLQQSLAIQLPRNSRLASIIFYSPDAQLAARVANAYAESLIADNLARRYRTSAYARDFLQQQLAETKRRLEASERAAINYARSAGLIDTSAGDTGPNGQRAQRSLTTSSLVAMNEVLSVATAERLRAQQRWERTQAIPPLQLPEVVSNQAVQQLYQKRAELEAEYQGELERRKQDYPTVKQAAAQILELDQQIAAIAGGIKAGIRQGYDIAMRQEQAIRSQLDQLRGNTLAEQQRGIQYGILRREVDTNRELYDGLLQRFKEVGAAAGVTANNISVVDTAEPERVPSSPRPVLNMALAGLLGVIFAFAAMVARELFDDAVRSPDDVESKLGAPLLGSVPLLDKNETAIDELSKLRSPMSEAYASIRTSLEFAGERGFPRTLLTTSSQPSEGKSTSSYALARSLAQVGKRVLLIDGDLRKPNMHRLVGLKNVNGLSTLLIGRNTPDEVIQQTDIDNLSFIACGPLPPNPTELYARGALRDLLARLLERFDVIVIDGPPVMGLADAPLLASIVEGVVFLVDASRSHRGRSRLALRRLLKANGKLSGVILTKFDARHQGYEGYGYSYEYGSAGNA
ncbi:polysaccharide biosynthesis tyrosine autokinase [Sphingomonas sp. 1P06PA]|uniref:GumC family protein n=1 Tax=Sphingomonas sp. 1P06PA TaxID=554121 RepID=UPI0039A5F57F